MRNRISKKNFFSVMVVAFLAVSSLCSAQEKKSLSLEEAEKRAIVLFEKLMSSFNPDWETMEPAPTDYPVYYGGSFINNDGKLVVQTIGDSETHRATVAKTIGSNDFITETCTYSYREMMEVMNKIDEFIANRSIPNSHPVIVNFSGAAANVLSNRVEVNLLEVNDSIIKAFRRDVSDSPAIVFEKGSILMQ